MQDSEVYDTALKWAEYGNTMMNSTDPVHLEGEEILTRVSRPYHFGDLEIGGDSGCYVPVANMKVLLPPSFRLVISWPDVTVKIRDYDLNIYFLARFEHVEDYERRQMFELAQLDFEELFSSENGILLNNTTFRAGLSALHWTPEKKKEMPLLWILNFLEDIFFTYGKKDTKVQRLLNSTLNTVRIYCYFRLHWEPCLICQRLSPEISPKRVHCHDCERKGEEAFQNAWAKRTNKFLKRF